MKDKIEDIIAYLKKTNSFRLPEYRELPSVELYMEQVLAYVNKALADLSDKDQATLTSFMVNNYVKAGMIDEPVKKRYSKEQIGYLIAITLLKQTVSMADISLLLELDKGISTNKEDLYNFFREMESDILAETSRKTLQKADGVSKKYRLDARSSEEKAEQNARNAFAFIALRLAVQAQANKILSDYIISTLRADIYGEKGESLASSKKETKAHTRGEAKTAKVISKAKKGPKKNKGRKRKNEDQ